MQETNVKSSDNKLPGEGATITDERRQVRQRQHTTRATGFLFYFLIGLLLLMLGLILNSALHEAWQWIQYLVGTA